MTINIWNKGEKGFSNAILILYSVGVLFSASYFMWETYPITVVYIVARLYKILVEVVVFFYCCFKRRVIKIDNNRIAMYVYIFIVLSFIHFAGSVKSFYRGGELLLLIDAFIILFLFNDEENSYVFRIITYGFSIIVLPSVIYYLITISFGVELPYYKLLGIHAGKISSGIYYELRPFGLIINAPGGYVARLCGIYDEPGVVGTFSALLLSASMKNTRRFRAVNILLFVEGVLSFSFAFYLLFFISLLLLFIDKSLIKGIMLILFVGICGVIFFNINFDNQQINSIKKRFNYSIENGLEIENDRYNKEYEAEYNKFIEDGGYELVFGNGYAASSKSDKLSGGSVYSRLIYDYGILGTILYIGVFLFVLLGFGINKKNITFILVFFISIYQRPYVLVRDFFVIYLCALFYLKRLELKDSA
ncbi:MAG: hypothetical protein E7279_03715 [Lachnospiraceae bacterium]|nr:hypothetical protein [Lachnospiraceae bacterium]